MGGSLQKSLIELIIRRFPKYANCKILLETGTIDQSDSSTTLSTASGDSSFYIIQDTSATAADRPNEGDVVYHPVLDKMFQVNFVDHDEPFYQLDNNPVYKLRCRLYDYSAEVIDTGIANIDAIEDELSIDALVHQFTMEQSSAVTEEIRLELGTGDDAGLLLEETDGDNILGESDSTSVGESMLIENSADTGDNSYIIQEDYIVGDMVTDKNAQNELFTTQSATVLDFTESNPFGDVGSNT